MASGLGYEWDSLIDDPEEEEDGLEVYLRPPRRAGTLPKKRQGEICGQALLAKREGPTHRRPLPAITGKA